MLEQLKTATNQEDQIQCTERGRYLLKSGMSPPAGLTAGGMSPPPAGLTAARPLIPLIPRRSNADVP